MRMASGQLPYGMSVQILLWTNRPSRRVADRVERAGVLSAGSTCRSWLND